MEGGGNVVVRDAVSLAMGRPLGWDASPDASVRVNDITDDGYKVTFEQCKNNAYPSDLTQLTNYCMLWTVDYKSPLALSTPHPTTIAVGEITRQESANVPLSS